MPATIRFPFPQRSIAAGFLLLVFCGICAAQAKVYRLGILDGGSPLAPGRKYVFVRELEKLGFAEGGNLVIDARQADFDYPRLDSLARELVQRRPDVIVGIGPSSIAAAAAATRTIPIVMLYSGDPVGLGLVKDLARPGGNITGNGWEQDPRQIAKTIEALRELAPNASRLGLLWHVDNRSHPLYEARFRKAGQEAGLQVASFGIRRGAEAVRKLQELGATPMDALVIFEDVVVVQYGKEVDAIIRRGRIPAALTSNAARAFELPVIVYGPRASEFPVKTAEYVARILNGTRPGDLPIVLPTKFELVLNRKAARSLGIDLPGALLLRADAVED